MNRMIFRDVFGVAILSASSVMAQAAAPTTLAAPMHTLGAREAFPRLTAHPDPKLMARINEQIASAEASARSGYAECLSQLESSGMAVDPEAYKVETTVRYLSSRYLCLDITTDYFCGGAYPNRTHTPLTFDLRSGEVIDWAAAFVPGFLPLETPAAEPSPLTRLYRSRCDGDFKEDPDCRDVVMKRDPFVPGSLGGSAGDAPIFWLDAKEGLVVQPNFPHVTQACANSHALPLDALAPYLRDGALLEDLKVTVVTPR